MLKARTTSVLGSAGVMVPPAVVTASGGCCLPAPNCRWSRLLLVGGGRNPVAAGARSVPTPLFMPCHHPRKLSLETLPPALLLPPDRGADGRRSVPHLEKGLPRPLGVLHGHVRTTAATCRGHTIAMQKCCVQDAVVQECRQGKQRVQWIKWCKAVGMAPVV